MTDRTIGLGGGYGNGPRTPVDATASRPSIRGYDIGDRLGEGGYGEVWRAVRLDPGPRTVAIKVLRTRVATDRDADRFRREASLLARLEHPGIASVLDAGTLADGRPWFAIEFVDGRPLGEILDEPRSLEQRIDLVRQTCAAIAHAHARGIVHCDLKPANILVSESARGDVVKVIDFGVARLHEGEQPGRTMITSETGGVLGTPAYMAPEQLASGEIDTRVDVWAMGVVLAETLGGRRPFETSIEEGGVLEEQRRIREEEPVPPSVGLTTLVRRDPAAAVETAARRGVALRELVRSLRRELDWVVLKCLQRAPDERYASVTALSDDLQRYLRHEPLDAGPPSARYRLGKFLRRHRAAVAATLAMVALLVAGIVGTGIGLVRANASAEKERDARRSAERRLTQFESINDLNRRILTAVDPEIARGLDTTLLQRTLLAAEAAIPEDADPMVRSQILLTLAESWSHLDEPAESLELMTASLASARTAAEEGLSVPGLTDDLGIAEIQGGLGKVLIDASAGLPAEAKAEKRRDAERLLREAIEVNERTLGETHPRVLRNRANLAWLMMLTGRLDDGLDLLERVHELRIETLGPRDDATLGSGTLLSDILIKLGRGTPERYEQARAVVVELLGERPEPDDSSSPNELLLLNNLAVAESRLGHQQERLRLADALVGRFETIFGPQHTTTLTIRYNHATTLIDRGRFQPATEALEACLQGYRARTEPGSVQIVRTLSRLGQVARLAGRPAEARRHFELVIREAATAAEHEATPAATRRERHLDAAGAALQLAVMARLEGRFDDGRARLTEVASRVASAGGDPRLSGLHAAETIELGIAEGRVDVASLETAATTVATSLSTLPATRRLERATMLLAMARRAHALDGDDASALERLDEVLNLVDEDGRQSSRPIRQAAEDWRQALQADRRTDR